MTDEHSISEGGRDYGAFIPRMIDDYGLDPYEFRIYCRLERRIGRGSAGCFESIANMAVSCKMSQQKVRNALQVLVLTGIAKQEKCKGKTDRYVLMPPEHWVDSSRLDEIRLRVTAYRQESDAKSTAAKQNRFANTPLQRSEPPHYSVVDTPLQRSDKGSPIKDLQLRISIEEEEAPATSNQYLDAEIVEKSDLAFVAVIQSEETTKKAQPQDFRQEKFSGAKVEPLKELEAIAFNWQKRPWRLNATEFKPEMSMAVWMSNQDEYSVADGSPNHTYIRNRLKKLDNSLKKLDLEGLDAYIALQDYWKTAIAMANPETQQEFCKHRATVSQMALQSKLNANKQSAADALKDL